jgi:hypothetical protein
MTRPVLEDPPVVPGLVWVVVVLALPVVEPPWLSVPNRIGPALADGAARSINELVKLP